MSKYEEAKLTAFFAAMFLALVFSMTGGVYYITKALLLPATELRDRAIQEGRKQAFSEISERLLICPEIMEQVKP